MKLIEIEKLKGAKRLHRQYKITNRDNFKYDGICEWISDSLIEFPSEHEAIFQSDVASYREHQIKELSKEMRIENVIQTVENEAKQGSDEWLKARIGIITASKTPFTSKGLPIPTYDTYVNGKVADAFIENNGGEKEESYTSEAMQIGTELEHYAIEDYEEFMGVEVEARGLIVGKDMMIGASPDGVTVDVERNIINIEVKSVLLRTYLSELHSNTVTKRYNTQMQVQMFMLNCDVTNLVVQCQQNTGQPLMTIIRKVYRDEEFVSNMIETIKQYEMDFKLRYDMLTNSIKS